MGPMDIVSPLQMENRLITIQCSSHSPATVWHRPRSLVLRGLRILVWWRAALLRLILSLSVVHGQLGFPEHLRWYSYYRMIDLRCVWNWFDLVCDPFSGSVEFCFEGINRNGWHINLCYDLRFCDDDFHFMSGFKFMSDFVVPWMNIFTLLVFCALVQFSPDEVFDVHLSPFHIARWRGLNNQPILWIPKQQLKKTTDKHQQCHWSYQYYYYDNHIKVGCLHIDIMSPKKSK